MAVHKITGRKLESLLAETPAVTDESVIEIWNNVSDTDPLSVASLSSDWSLQHT